MGNKEVLFNKIIEISNLVENYANIKSDIEKRRCTIKNEVIAIKKFINFIDKYKSLEDIIAKEVIDDERFNVGCIYCLRYFPEYINDFCFNDFKAVFEEILPQIESLVDGIKYHDLHLKGTCDNDLKVSTNVALAMFRRDNAELYDKYDIFIKKVEEFVRSSYFFQEIESSIGVDRTDLFNFIRELNRDELHECPRIENLGPIDTMYFDKIEDIIKNTREGIEKQAIEFMPRKYAFDSKFYAYAVECLYYGRCETMGEILDRYEGYSFHEELMASISSIVNKLDDISMNQFYQIMQLESISSGIDSLNTSIGEVNIHLNSVNQSVRDSVTANIEIERAKIESASSLTDRFNIYNRVALNVVSGNVEYRRSLAERREHVQLELNKINGIGSNTKAIALSINDARGFSDMLVGANTLSGKITF